MTKETYQRRMEWLLAHPGAVRGLKGINLALTAVVFCAYPLFLSGLFVEKDPGLLRAVLVPAISFAAVSVFRQLVNRPRPYERFGVPAALSKDTPGKSFPSRHVFSVFVIASTVFVWNHPAGIALGFLGVVLAAIRVIGGVHTVADVTAGMMVGILSGIIGYGIL